MLTPEGIFFKPFFSLLHLKEAEAKSLTRGGATRIKGRGEHPASLVDRQELANK